MSKKKTLKYAEYLQKRINSGTHPDKLGKLLKIKSSSILNILRKNKLTFKYKHKTFSNIRVNIKLFRNINTELEAYYLGLLLADGCVFIKRKSYELSICLQQKDTYILNLLSKYITNDNIIKDIKIKNQKALRITNFNICNNLIKYSVVPNKSYVCNSIPYLSEELMPHFIRGYFDGDGSVYTKKQRYRVGSAISFTGHYNFISSLELYLKSRNILSTKVKTKQKEHQFDSVFEFEKKQDIKNLYTYMYKDASIYLTRKKDKFII